MKRSSHETSPDALLHPAGTLVHPAPMPSFELFLSLFHLDQEQSHWCATVRDYLPLEKAGHALDVEPTILQPLIVSDPLL